MWNIKYGNYWPTRRNSTNGSIMKTTVTSKANSREFHQWMPNHCCKMPKCTTPSGWFPERTSPEESQTNTNVNVNLYNCTNHEWSIWTKTLFCLYSYKLPILCPQMATTFGFIIITHMITFMHQTRVLFQLDQIMFKIN